MRAGKLTQEEAEEIQSRSAYRLDGHRLDCRSFLSSFRVVHEAATASNMAPEQAKLTAADAAAGDRLGWSVSMDGDYTIFQGQRSALMTCIHIDRLTRS